MAYHSASHSLASLEEATAYYEEILRLKSARHELHWTSVADLGKAIYRLCYDHRQDKAQGQRCLKLFRLALDMNPPGRPLRDESLHALALVLLFIDYEQLSGGTVAISESILMCREALILRPVGHPGRGRTLNILGCGLERFFPYSGDMSMMDEAVCAHREALQLHPPGHPLRMGSIGNLANSLAESYEHQGRFETLAESILLQREALECAPVGHPIRFRALDNLAAALLMRFHLDGHRKVLSEAISLFREALQLMSGTHPERSRTLYNLAESLMADFRQEHDSSTLAEAIAHLRQSVQLATFNRDHALHNLSIALALSFDTYGDHNHLLEGVALSREVLELRPRGHNQRFQSLHLLGNLLCRGECQSWTEALAVYKEAYECCPSGYFARANLLSDMSICFLNPASPFFDVLEGISRLSEGYLDNSSPINKRLKSAVSDLRRVESAYDKATSDSEASTRDDRYLDGRILDLYTQVVGLLPLAANIGLNHTTRLQVLVGSDQIARNAAARALILGNTPQAVEILEEGRGIFWSQSLHLRATGFDGVQDGDRQELIRLLSLLQHGAHSGDHPEKTAEHREKELETRRRLNTEAEALIARIRTYPGLSRFLLPALFEGLMRALPDGFVVIVNASSIAHHALILHRPSDLAESLTFDLPSTGFNSASLRSHLPRDMSLDNGPHQASDTNLRAMRLSSGLPAPVSLDDVLALLWTSIVWPVLSKLKLEVSSLLNVHVRL
jgi:tetratricopeptide (TPR) repeat protein